MKSLFEGIEVMSEEQWVHQILKDIPHLTHEEAKQVFNEEALAFVNQILRARKRCLDAHIPDLWELGEEDVPKLKELLDEQGAA